MTTLVYDNNSFFNFNSSFNSLLDGIMEKVPGMLGPDSPPMASNAVTENVVVTETIQQTTVAPSDVILDDPGLTTEPTFQTRPKPLNHNLRRFMKESWFDLWRWHLLPFLQLVSPLQSALYHKKTPHWIKNLKWMSWISTNQKQVRKA